MQWIKYLSTTEGVCIQHARNGGEKEIGPYKVDGYSMVSGRRNFVLKTKLQAEAIVMHF
jgi:hypothetical protein